MNGDDSKQRKRGSDENFTRFYINLGKMDRINPAKLMGLINENLNKNDVEIGQIEILKSFSFFEIDKTYADTILTAFKNAEYNGRSVIVEITTKPKGRDRSRSKRNFGGGDRRSRNEGFGGRKKTSGGYSGNKNSKFGSSQSSSRRSKR